jgi:hypothetical protein
VPSSLGSRLDALALKHIGEGAASHLMCQVVGAPPAFQTIDLGEGGRLVRQESNLICGRYEGEPTALKVLDTRPGRAVTSSAVTDKARGKLAYVSSAALALLMTTITASGSW